MDEIADFKQNINLPSVAESLGFVLNKSKSSISTVVMAHPVNNETFHFFTNAKTKDQLFRNIHNSKQVGTVIDLYQLMSPGLNLGQVRVALRPFLNLPPTRRQFTISPSFQQRNPDDSVNQFIVHKLTNTHFLNSRGIKDDTLFSQKFNNTINQVHLHSSKYNKTFENTAFPIKHKGITLGLDVRNKTKEGSFKHAAATSKRSLGVWTSNKPDQTDKILIVESPIDALAHYQSNPIKNKGTFYIATNGQPSEQHVIIIKEFIDELDPPVIALGNDNDNAGIRFNINYLSQLQTNSDVNWKLELNGNNFLEFNIVINIKPSFNGAKMEIENYNHFFTNHVNQINKEAKPSQIIAYEKPLKFQALEESNTYKHYKINLRNNYDTLKDLQELTFLLNKNDNLRIESPYTKDFNQDLIESNQHIINKHLPEEKTEKAMKF
ncbi:MAG: toprim domain-containing protein [Reichenbachiella sp.]|uniref:toprim domain-containing protein n=1 Tax=Reichenbachiella sp. TaxID=2184521 RepID=UPI00329811BF